MLITPDSTPPHDQQLLPVISAEADLKMEGIHLHTTDADTSVTSEDTACEDQFHNGPVEPIAIIGMSMKFPQEATSAEGFWDMLIGGRSALTDIPKDRFNAEAFHDPDPDKPGTIHTKRAHLLEEDIALFDAPFFSITSTEANCIDPQQRGLLECAYRALENAGIPMEKATGSKTSVHVGFWAQDYEALLQRDPDMAAKYRATGTASSIAANRISWFYDLRGSSVTVDTACSSSMVALHLACEGLRNRDASMGLVGGCNLIYSPNPAMSLTSLHFLSPDSKSYSFDHRANGYARGEGFGVVVLKLLSDALRDGDTIRAVIRATGTNQDGRTPGITQPSSQAQEQLIRDTYAKAKLDLKTTRFVEAHGTGTSIGDPLEAKALASVFQQSRSADEPLYVGAVKSNIGHLEAASGMPGLIKTVLVLESGTIPPNIWFEKPNPRILPEWNLKFPTKPTAWPSKGLRRASVNSFGFGGSNAHAVLDDAYHYLQSRGLSGNHHTVAATVPTEQETLGSALTNGLLNGVPTTDATGKPIGRAPETTVDETDIVSITIRHQKSADKLIKGATKLPSSHRLFVWSSSDEGGLKRLAALYTNHLSSKQPEEEGRFLDNLSYTLACKRSRFPWKSFIVADSHQELLRNLGKGLPKPTRTAPETPKIGFVFTGQGAQWHAMGRELSAYPAYRDSLAAARDYLYTLGCRWSLTDELQQEAQVSKVNDPAYSQPLCAAVQIALVDLLRTWNVEPAAVVGHSSGEIAAAYCAGAISRQAAWKIAYYRGLLSSALAKFGRSRCGMMAVGLSAEAVQPYISTFNQGAQPSVTVGCINSPVNITLTGAAEALTELKTELAEQNVFCQVLKVDNAYHSHFMQEIALDYWRSLSTLEGDDKPLNPTRTIPMFSSVTGDMVPIDQLSTSEYWVQNMISPVRFSEALSKMLVRSTKGSVKKLGARRKTQEGLDINFLLEVGPHGALRRYVKEILDGAPAASFVNYDSLLTRNVPAASSALNVVGRLFCMGVPLDFTNLNLPQAGKPAILVDLPEYPFNHTQKYWAESRISKNFRFREHSRNQVLGTQVPDWDPKEARWRSYIRLSEQEWIRDHQIAGQILYPAAGMAVMAIEAARQLAGPSKTIHGFALKDLVFDKALIIPSSAEGIEVEFYLRPVKLSNFETSTVWSEFKLCSYSNGEWHDHCRGAIKAELEQGSPAKDANKEAEWVQKNALLKLEDYKKRCNIFLEGSSLYKICKTYDFAFGPSFQTISKLHYNMQSEGVAEVSIKEGYRPHVNNDLIIHPTTLDGIFQTIIAPYLQGGRQSKITFVPSHIEKLWVSSDVCPLGSTTLQSCGATLKRGLRELECSIVAANSTGDKLLATIDNFRAISIANREEPSVDEGKPLCFQMEWQPDIDLLEAEKARRLLLISDVKPSMSPQDLERMSFYYIHKAWEKIASSNIVPEKEHLKKYVRWLQRRVERVDSDEIVKDILGDSSKTAKLHEWMKTSAEGKLLHRMGPKLPAILKGDMDPLELMFQDDLMTEAYRSGFGLDLANQNMERCINLIAHKQSNLSILEIGAGTGGATVSVLRALQGQQDVAFDHPRFSHYTYTDISPSFFEKAKETFKEHRDRMTFQILNIEDDPAQQGFDLGTYDLVIAANVIHATRDLNNTLTNTRKLMKPGGRLLLLEGCNPESIRLGLPFGLLPGWWLSVEGNRQSGPLMREADWNQTLSRNGFTGNDVVLRDHEEDGNHIVSVILSTAGDECTHITHHPQKTVIVTKDGSPFQHAIATSIQQSLQAIDRYSSEISVCSLEQVTEMSLQDTVCIFLPEVETPFLANLDPSGYGCLQHLVTAKSILWLYPSAGDPAYELVVGFARTMRSENTSLKFVTLGVECVDDPSKIAETASKVLKTTVFGDHSSTEDEYVEKDGLLHINRLVAATHLNDQMKGSQSSQKVEQQPLSLKRPVKLTIASPGLLDTLHFIDDPQYEQPLNDDEVEIAVKATAMNFRDVMTALAQLPSSHLGFECSGVVTRTGKNSHCKVGDRVWAWSSDTFRTHARAHSSLVQLLPDGLSLEEAACIPIVYGTCVYALHDLARLKAGEKVLIHSAAGGVGQAAICLARHVGAEIFATVGSEDKKRFLVDSLYIPEDHIFSSRNTSFELGIKRMTNGYGVDVVLNSLAGELLHATWNCMAPFGRFVELGKKDIISNTGLPMSVFDKNVSFSSVDLSKMYLHNMPLASKLLADVNTLLVEGNIKAPHPIKSFTFGQVEEAFRVLQGGKHIGKIVLTPEEGELVPIVRDTRSKWSFDPNASYVIAGGLGGLGRSIAQWMVGRGARNLILLSRSGVITDNAKQLVADLEASSCVVAAPPCDISKKDDLAAILADCARKMPPVKGCVQGAMVLRDATLSNMPYDDYTAAIRPKVEGSWNLHQLLPKRMDFFILLSSVTGVIGNAGQSNYASGNTYQDALARYRIIHGEKAVALDLGMMDSVGYVAERPELMSSVKAAGHKPIPEEDFLNLLDYHCAPNLPLPSATDSQIIIGLETPTSFTSKGHDPPQWLSRPLFRPLYALDTKHTHPSSSTSTDPTNDITTLLSTTPSTLEAAHIITTALTTKLAKSLSIDPSEIDTSKPMHVYGVDSLVAVEVRNWLAKEVKADVAVFELMGNLSIEVLGGVVAGKSRVVRGRIDGEVEE